jgi:hypothetical protein
LLPISNVTSVSKRQPRKKPFPSETRFLGKWTDFKNEKPKTPLAIAKFSHSSNVEMNGRSRI